MTDASVALAAVRDDLLSIEEAGDIDVEALAQAAEGKNFPAATAISSERTVD